MLISDKKDQYKSIDHIAYTRQRWLYITILPWLYCAVYTFKYGYDVPYWDQWDKIPLLLKSIDGTIRLGDYWTLINEHRVFVPNLILIPLAKLSHWNLYWELLVTLLSATFSFVIFLMMIMRWERKYDRKDSLWIVPLTALLWFSFSQYNIWMWGLHAMIAITMLFTIAMIALLSLEKITWPILIGAAICALASSLSFGTGIASWIAGFFMIILYSLRNRSDGFIKGSIWIVLALLAMAIYFYEYKVTPANVTAIDAFQAPHRFLLYVVAYMGGAISPFHGGIAFIFGMVILVSLFSIPIMKSRSSEPIQEYIRFAFGAITMSMGCALLTAMKQWPEGIHHAVSSRYIPWSSLGWVGLVILLYFSYSDQYKKRVHGTVVAIAIVVIFGGLYGTYKADERYDGYMLGRQALIENETDSAFIYLYPDPEKVVQYRRDLIQYHLTIFQKED